jgi:hypothetical protein
MAVVINEFEVVSQSSAPPPPPQQNSGAAASSPGDLAKEIEKALRKKMERKHRLSTY